MKFALVIYLALLTGLPAQYQKVDAPINRDKNIYAFHLYHFNSSTSQLTLHEKKQDLGSAMEAHKHRAGISVSAENAQKLLHLLRANPTNSASPHIGPLLLKNGQTEPELKPSVYTRRTFLLHNGKNLWAVGYSPVMNQKQLAYALRKICQSCPASYIHAYQINEGSPAALWVSNNTYHPFYLKELSPATIVLGIDKQ